MKNITTLTWIFMFLFSFKTIAQESTRFQRQSFEVENNKPKILKSESPITSISFKITYDQLLTGFWIETADERFEIKPDAHNPEHSELIVFSKPISEFKITSNGFRGVLTMDKIYVKPLLLPKTTERGSKIGADCEKPTVIPASTWRAGITPPKELPVQTVTKHIIVHHAAGSNTATNYTDVVRNIYTFHTRTNGWNDVGYNFLIAQDGTIYEGRDGQNIMDGDNVLGAHFCSQNGGTMGICLLGDYMTAQPTDKSLESLAKLMAWKLKKEKIEPLSTGLHTASGRNLKNISAHRDGSCATNCPGDNIYAKLEQIRQNTASSCDFSKPLAFEDDLDILPKIYPNPSNGKVWVSSPNAKSEIILLDGLGREISIDKQSEGNRKWSFSTNGLSSGVYFIRVEGKTSKLVIE
ncbi:MAG: N-acetylmuramoyl-L-alanine amidase [Arcicella sp.]|nr:N-acetylmuramoyl-L-alanine amidase [Arcicella sp.]